MPAAFARAAAVKLISMHLLDGGQWRSDRNNKKKSNDQRAPVIRYYLIKEPGL